MKRYIFQLFLTCLSVSCVREGIQEPDLSCCDEKVEVGFIMTVDGSPCGGEVKSILQEDVIEDMVTDVTVASYDENGVMVDVQYFSDLYDICLYISRNGDNTVYALANMGDMTASFPSMEEDVSSLVYMVDSYEDIKAVGIPMCAVATVSVSTVSPRLQLERLFAKVNLRILHTSLDHSNSIADYAFNLCNKSLYVRQANRRLYPFAESGSRAMTDQDIMGQSDFNPDLDDRTVHPDPSKMGPGPGYWQDTTIVVYVPENRQGVLLPSNDDPFMKSADNITSVNGIDYSGLCTYIELNTKKEALGSGLSGSVIYRCYLGADNVTDFNVERNGRYDVTMDLTQESFGMNCWKVSKGEDWKDTRSLQFLEDSYVIYPGTTRDVFVHYNTLYGLGYDSQSRADDWTYSFDDEGMAEAGLAYSFDPSVLKLSADSKKNFCFTFTASGSAVTGKAFPLTVVSKDGSLVDESMIYVSEIGDLSLEWDKVPLYVAQYGVVNVNGAIDAGLPLSVKVSDPSIVRCTAIDGDSFRVVALRPGTVELAFSDKSGMQTCSVTLNIGTPKLKITTRSIALNPDGAPVGLAYSFIDSRGLELSGFDPEAFRTSLLPVVSDNAYFSTDISSQTVSIMISRLYDEGVQINTGSSYNLTLKAVNCPEAGVQTVSVYVIDPFDDIYPRDYGRIDDYTLLTMENVDSRLRGHFSPMVESNSTFEYEAPCPNADKSCLTADLVPEWTSGYSNPNDVYSVAYRPDDGRYASGASFSVKMNAVTSTSDHGAGRHQVGLSVANRHSGEKIRHVCGYVGIYVHTALGAKAVFGSQYCNYRPEGAGYHVPAFAEIYNDMAGYTLFSPQSGSRIYYMDVSAEFLTDVNNVYVYDRLLAGALSSSNVMDAVDILQPSVTDGQSKVETQLIFSVDGGAGERVSFAGEEYGGRKGIGVMLYRAIRLQTYDKNVSYDEMTEWFFGLDANGNANFKYAPCYEVHDMMKGADMDLNTVGRSEPFYFAPTSCPEKTDKDGKGYHVIHFLEEVAPETRGWINLL